MKIGFINTGGTISCVESGSGLSPLSAEEFRQAFHRLMLPILLSRLQDLEIEHVDVEFNSSSNTLDSTNLQPSDWCLIAEKIVNNYEKYDGWIILHGTDSMDFTASALPFMLSSFRSDASSLYLLDKPIVITGSQVPMFHRSNKNLELRFNSDAFGNICGSFEALKANISEVCVFFGGKLLRGNRVVKVNADGFQAFSSPNYPILGRMGINLELYSENIRQHEYNKNFVLSQREMRDIISNQIKYLKSNINNYPVVQLKAFPSWYGKSSSLMSKLIDSIVKSGAKGIVLESYGEGNFPSGNPDNPGLGANYKSLLNASNAGVLIADSTQVLTGRVDDQAYAAGSWLSKVVAIATDDMTSFAAFSKLSILLSLSGLYGYGV